MRMNTNDPITESIFFMQEMTKVRRRGAKKESHEQITAIPLIPNKVQTRANKLRQINLG